MRDDYISRKAVMASLIEEYNRRKEDGGLKLAWIELAINRTPGTGWTSVREGLPKMNSDWHTDPCIVCMKGNACFEGWEDFEYEILTGRFLAANDMETNEKSLCFEPDRVTQFMPDDWDLFVLDKDFKAHLDEAECMFYTDDSITEAEYHDCYYQVLAWMPLPEPYKEEKP